MKATASLEATAILVVAVAEAAEAVLAVPA